MLKNRPDATDIGNLSAMQKHGALRKSKLANLVNLSLNPCWARLDKLKKAGLIARFQVNIAVDAIADATQVAVAVSFSNHRKLDFVRFETRIAKLSNIARCLATGGGLRNFAYD